jgi:hypothetical protein
LPEKILYVGWGWAKQHLTPEMVAIGDANAHPSYGCKRLADVLLVNQLINQLINQTATCLSEKGFRRQPGESLWLFKRTAVQQIGLTRLDT